MSHYLRALLDQALGRPADIRRRPRIRFEAAWDRLAPEAEADPSVSARQPDPGPAVERGPQEAVTTAPARPMPFSQTPAAHAMESGLESGAEIGNESTTGAPVVHERIDSRTHTTHETRQQERVVVERVEHHVPVVTEVGNERAEATPASVAPPVHPRDGDWQTVPRVRPPAIEAESPALPEPDRALPAGTQRTEGSTRQRRAQATVRPSSSTEPEISISIGRLDIRLTPAAESGRRGVVQDPAPAQTSAAVSLEDYLRQRSRGQS